VKRTRLQIDVRRGQLIDAALELFASRPYDQVAIADVARAAGVSHGLVFHHFGDKHRLYLAVLGRVADGLVGATAAAGDRTPVQQLYAGLEAHLDFAARYPDAYAAFLRGGAGADPEALAIIDTARRQGLRHVLEALGIREPGAALWLALCGWQGFTEGAILGWLEDRALPRDKLLEMLALALDDALRLGGIEVSERRRPSG